ncbi:recombinase family protein [Microvirga lotononidis]|uniref:Site-specific recombinase, DNA invertase Pin n=1 Tax=Microvirga lotononidis TaxID=864069 RepID=I4YTA0_9HYPH|nr:recombinase family protein [Microvirga lotononidis]EIM27192.1 site-specific recombinase, DNA invertase Pin [Microvirga lotononidis]WQO28628.1 recombinase family protein [Microvirga lotononidis]
MIIGYARTSTTDQKAGLEAQERDLRAAGVERIFQEQISATGPRKAFADALDYVRDGDTLIVTKLDRLARSVADLVEITKQLEAKGASLRVLNLNLDTETPTGKLMLNLLGSIAQFERELMLERQREGIAKAKSEGKYKGRKPTAKAKMEDVLRLVENGLSREQVAKELGIGVASVYRVLASARS